MIERLALGPAHLAGSSYGAFIALLAAAKRPELVRTLVLGEPPVGYLLVSDPAAKPVWDQFFSAVELARASIRAGDLETGLRTFVDRVIGAGAFDMLPPPVREMMLDNASTLAIEAEPREVFAEAEAARVTMPVLLVTGERSPPMFGQITDRLHRLLPHAAHRDPGGVSCHARGECAGVQRGGPGVSVASLVNACDTHLEKLVVWTLLDTGLRVSELAFLARKDIDWRALPHGS